MGLISNEVFHALCGGYRTFIPLVQAEGLKERSRKQLQTLVNAIINKKEREGTRRNDNFLKADGRLLGMWITKKHRSKAKKSTTYQSLNQWFDFISDFFVSMGFTAKCHEATVDVMEDTSEE